MVKGWGNGAGLAVAMVTVLSALALLALRTPVHAPPPPPPHPLPAASLPQPEIALWLSTQDRRLRLARQPNLSADAQAAAQPSIRIDTAQSFQRITGFGAALTDASAWLLQHKLDAAQRAALLQEVFGPPPGLGLDMTRLTIGASDFSLKPYTLDDMPAGQVDPELAHFNVAANLDSVIPTVREALAVNPQLHIVASPWSAPAWMKTNGQLIGGSLLPQYEGAYARYLVKYVDTYRSLGIPIDALTVQNEPAFLPLSYPGMALSATVRARLIAQYLGPALDGMLPRTRILGWDHNWDDPGQPLAVLADLAAAPYVDGIAWHCYRGSPAAQSQVHRAHPRKSVYVTECSGGDWESAKNGELLWFARDLLLGSLRNWAQGVIYWNLALDEDHGPHAGGCDNCKGMLTIDAATGAVSRNDEYYAFAHYSRFVRPGAVRVWSTATVDGLANVAFRNAGDGPLVLVVTNSGKQAQEVSVQQDRIAFHYRMPPESVASFVWEADQAAGPWTGFLRRALRWLQGASRGAASSARGRDGGR